jgi:hypothetical protein
VPSHFFTEEVEQVSPRAIHAHLLCAAADCLANSDLLTGVKEIRHFTCAEHVGDIFDHGLLLKLRIIDQEHRWLPLLSSGLENCLQVVCPVCSRICAGDLHLVELAAFHEGSQPGEGLATGSAKANEQSMVIRLPQHAADTSDMLQCKGKQNELHGRFCVGIVLGQVLPNNAPKVRHALEFNVQLGVGAWHYEVSKEEGAQLGRSNLPFIVCHTTKHL